jgi:glycosyltransferase involved in cell wall biosynthesis
MKAVPLKIHYLSPSLLPSRTANSVHVLQQCLALARTGVQVTLYAKRTVPDEAALRESMFSAYGVSSDDLVLKTYYSAGRRGDTLRIALMAIGPVLRASSDDIVLSRNLYGAFALAVVFGRQITYETHQLEFGLRKLIQRLIISNPCVLTVVISARLLHHLQEHHGLFPARHMVLHDAACEGIQPTDANSKRDVLRSLTGLDVGASEFVCGYFGQLFSGRGIEVIEAMAAQRPTCLFLVYGGNESDVIGRRKDNRVPNLLYMGHAPHATAQRVMAAVDVLLMPYQKKVSIGVPGHDTARWMSPMKMFEYMATGVPILSSDLPVLREVLEHEKNCLLVPPADEQAWVAALDRLRGDCDLAVRIGAQAHRDYADHYTWTRRAEKIIEAERRL